MDCLTKFPFVPQQAGYTADFADGIVSSGIDGGPSFRRLDTTGNPFSVSASWVLACDDYDMFQGYVRNWMRSGGDPFIIDLVLEGLEAAEYQATFVPGTVRLSSKNGNVIIVNAQLEVLPNFVSPCNDEWAARALMEAVFGDDACEAIDILDKVVNEDLVYVRA